jgi:hypothetical protein
LQDHHYDLGTAACHNVPEAEADTKFRETLFANHLQSGAFLHGTLLDWPLLVKVWTNKGICCRHLSALLLQ